MNMDIQKSEKKPRNSFLVEASLLISNTDCLGTKVTTARRLLEDEERYGLETYKVPSEVLKPPLGALCVGGALSIGMEELQKSQEPAVTVMS